MKISTKLILGLLSLSAVAAFLVVLPDKSKAVNTVPTPVNECLTTVMGGYIVCYTLDNVTITPTNVNYTYGSGGSQAYSISAHLKIDRARTSPQIKNINFFGLYSAVQSGTNVPSYAVGYNTQCTPGVNDNFLACSLSGAAYAPTGSDESWGSLNDTLTIHDSVIVNGGEYITIFTDLRYSFIYTYNGLNYSVGQFATGPTLTITGIRPQCSISSFTADSPTVSYNGSTNLRFALSGSFPWNISTLSGSGSASPSSGTSSSGVSSSGSLTSTTTYRLSCGSTYRDVTVSVASAPVCSPSNASGSPGSGVFLSASGGDGNYSWSTPSSSTSCGNSASCTVTYSSAGTYSATVTSAGQSSNCSVNISSLCGNGVINPGEQCDGSNLNGQTCSSQGYVSGTLSCNSNCTFNTSACSSSGTQSISASKLSCTGSNATYNIHAVSTANNFYIKLIDALGSTNIMTSMNEPVTTATGRDYTTGAWVTNNMRFQLINAGTGAVMAETNVGNTGCVTTSPTCTISASPSSGTGSATGNLTWSSSNATSCTASGGWSGAKATSGTQSYGTIYSSTTYSLSCTNGSTTGSCSTTVNVGASTPLYRCSGSSCIRDDISGSYTTSNCNNTCSVVTPKYRCSGSSCIRDDISGSYTTSNCNNTCSVATLSCAPAIQNVTAGQYANFAATGGTGSYFWVASGGNPSVGYNWMFSTAYPSQGAYSVAVYSGTQTAYCSVSVQPAGGGPSDLTVSNFYLTDASGNAKNTFAPGENIYPAVTIYNNSPNPAVSSQGFFYISLYSNAPGVVTPGTGSDVGVWAKETGSIPAWGFKTYSITTNSAYWTNDGSNQNHWTKATLGSYTARAYVDSFNYVTETNESNNQAIYSYVVGSSSLPPSVNIDLPAANATVSGNVQIAGWAMDNTTQVETAISSVKVYIDGAFAGNATAYNRSDVCAAYPGRVGCPNVGYQFTWNSASVANGTHTIRMLATDSDTSPKTAFIDRQVTVSNPPIADIKANGSDGPITISYNQTANITWTSTNAASCTVSPGGWTGANGSQTTPAITSSVTYTLTCINGGQTGSDFVVINIPPPPTNPVGSCPAPGGSLTASWTPAPGYTHHYFRAYDLANGWHNCTLTDICVDDLVATSYTFATVPGHTYSWWVHTRDTATGAYSNAVGTNVSCAAAVCPAGAVTLSATSISAGQSVTASAPSGWSGGSYNSSNSSIASVSGSSVRGVSAGTAGITGFGWTAPNGATSCSLSNTNLTVGPPPAPTISLTPN
ncbi:MAG: hypothetical protein M1400_00415, partial [Patescibacteria group bacterium]|nr:hypothetical protein [Patescibacteria group bacterium]